MDQKASTEISPYRVFKRDEWATLRADTPLTLTEEEVAALRGPTDPVSPDDVVKIYLPLSRLLSLYVAATQELFNATRTFLGARDGKVPYIVGVAGSVAVGKSTTSRVLKALLARWPNTPKVDLVTTDGFLYPNAILEERGLMNRKGFPESFDVMALLKFLADIKSGKRGVTAPVYSHLVYDIVRGEQITVDRPDILIVEGLNVLQPRRLPANGRGVPFVSDFFDFKIYIDADEDLIRTWYVQRFMRLRETAFRNPKSYFHRYSTLSDGEAVETATKIWQTINHVNLVDNILPTRPRADLILTKDATHGIETVALRRL